MKFPHFLLAASFVALPLAAAPRLASPEVTAGFLPHRFEPEDGRQVSLFAALAAGLPKDSTRHWSLRHGRLEISHDLLQDLAGGSSLMQWGNGPARGFADFLRQRHGVKLRAYAPGFVRYVPDDSLFPIGPQWALINPGVDMPEAPAITGVDVNVEKVWDKFDGADSLVIAVVDAGFNFHHPDLAGRWWVNRKEEQGLPNVDDDGNGFVDDSVGWNFVDSNNHPDDYHSHGTLVSSTIAANFDNHIGVAGALPRAKIMAVRVLDASGHGDQNDIAAGIRYAVDNGAKAINFSIGGGGDNAALRSAFQYAHDKGVPIVAAAGNEAVDLDKHPAFPSNLGLDNVVMVASINPQGALSPFSNFGASSVHLAAPGEKILACGIPPRKDFWKEDFEAGLGNWEVTGMGASAVQPIEGKQSLIWVSGNNATAATSGTIDLSGLRGAAVRFSLAYQPASASDALILEGNREGSAVWTEIAVFTTPVASANPVNFGLQDFDGSRFKLRFRTSLSSLRSTAGRAMKIDGIAVTLPDLNPPSWEIYDVSGGTSLAAPYVAAYTGLLRLACDRMGVPWTRARELQGVTPEAELSGKVSTGGRLNMYQGLSFYLSTLPSLRVRDSTAVSWHTGETAQFLVDVFPAPAQAYKLSDVGLGGDAQFDASTGKLTWAPKKAGNYTLTLFAEGATDLRRRLTLTVEAPVVARAAAGPGLLRVGARVYRLPDLRDGRSARLEIAGIDALGRSWVLRREILDAKSPADFPWPAGLAFLQPRVLLDGAELPEAR